MNLTEIYAALHGRRLVEDQYDFSLGWLGKSRSYYSAMTSLGREPSIEVLTTLAMRLKARAEKLDAHGLFEIQTRATAETVRELKVLATALEREIQRRCMENATGLSKTAEKAHKGLKSAGSATALVV